RAEGDGIRATGDGLGDIAGAGELGVRDDVHVAATGLVQVVTTGSGGVGDGGGHRDVDAQGLAIGHRARTHDHAGRAGAHQVHGGGVVHHSPGDDRDVQGTDELLEVQWLAVGIHVLRGDQGALDDQQVDPAGD